jgi:cytochrome b561
VQQKSGYGSTAKILHWLILVLLIGQYALGWLTPYVKQGAEPGQRMNLHISIGLVILAIMLVRFVWRLTHPVAPEASLPAWQRVSAEGLHWLLYALVFATTLSGWCYAAMRGWTVTVFGLLPLPVLVAAGSPMGRKLGELHSDWLIWLLLAALGLHVAAALAHLVVYRDRVMQRMLPGAG